MKAIAKLIVISIITLMSIACATAPISLPDKYNLGNKLVEVDQILKFRVKSWEKIDNQSLILRTDVKDYYLIILQRPAPYLVFSENIGISDTIDRIRSGHDLVFINDSTGREPYIIHKIYKLKDQQQAKEIKERLERNLSD